MISLRGMTNQDLANGLAICCLAFHLLPPTLSFKAIEGFVAIKIIKRFSTIDSRILWRLSVSRRALLREYLIREIPHSNLISETEQSLECRRKRRSLTTQIVGSTSLRKLTSGRQSGLVCCWIRLELVSKNISFNTRREAVLLSFVRQSRCASDNEPSRDASLHLVFVNYCPLVRCENFIQLKNVPRHGPIRRNDSAREVDLSHSLTLFHPPLLALCMHHRLALSLGDTLPAVYWRMALVVARGADGDQK